MKEELDLEPLAQKWHALRWAVREIDGHNFEQIENTMRSLPFQSGQPSVIIAHTIKGKGVSFMENKLAWHYQAPDDEQLRVAKLSDLRAQRRHKRLH